MEMMVSLKNVSMYDTVYTGRLLIYNERMELIHNEFYNVFNIMKYIRPLIMHSGDCLCFQQGAGEK